MERRASNPQKQLCLIALYLLIWGEAANVRFLPECLCYIFHNVSCLLLHRSDKVCLIFIMHGLVRSCFELLLVVSSRLWLLSCFIVWVCACLLTRIKQF
jgi:hypothetical protein